jgi:DNA-binding response OmpR family regulator
MKQIIVVEDDKDIRELLSFVLTEEHYTVTFCANAKEFKIELDKSRPDVILFDILLPDGNGIELCKGLKLDGRTRTIPVIIMSANKNAGDPIECGNLFIPKPFNIDDLKSKVESYLPT